MEAVTDAIRWNLSQLWHPFITMFIFVYGISSGLHWENVTLWAGSKRGCMILRIFLFFRRAPFLSGGWAGLCSLVQFKSMKLSCNTSHRNGAVSWLEGGMYLPFIYLFLFFQTNHEYTTVWTQVNVSNSLKGTAENMELNSYKICYHTNAILDLSMDNSGAVSVKKKKIGIPLWLIS